MGFLGLQDIACMVARRLPSYGCCVKRKGSCVVVELVVCFVVLVAVLTKIIDTAKVLAKEPPPSTLPHTSPSGMSLSLSRELVELE